MPLNHKENRRSGKIHYSDPSSKREWTVWKTRDVDEAITHLAGYSIPPSTDVVGGVYRYFKDMDYAEIGNGAWKFTANYAKDPSTISMEVNFTGGRKKMTESIALVRSYSCDSLTSATTQTASSNLSVASTALELEADALASSVPDATAAADQAQIFANDVDVDTGVFLLCVAAINQTRTAVLKGTSVQSLVQLIANAVANAVNAAAIGNAAGLTAVQDASALVTAYVANIVLDTAAASAAQLQAQSDATDAIALAASENADSQAAATKAGLAATAATQISNELSGMAAAVAAVPTAFTALIAAMTADAAAGIPNLGRMINVNDKGVDGVEIEDEACEITIVKHFESALLSPYYIQVLRSMSPSKNDAAYTINFKGQIWAFAAGELKFKNFTMKQTGDGMLDITFYLASSRGLTSDDNITIGNSSPIVKEGWDYVSTFYKDTVDDTAFVKAKKPKAAYIHQVYEAKDFTQLGL